MMNKAQEILEPQTGVFRTVFLHVGQGESTLLFHPEGSGHRVMLIDSNLDEERGGTNLVKMLEDLFDGGTFDELDYYVNTHPHSDHAGAIDDISDAVTIRNVWHSGHDPGREHGEAYQALKRLRDKVKKAGGEDRELNGTRETATLGDVSYNVLSPAKHVVDDIAGEDCEARYRRIHEHCTVLRFGYGSHEKAYVMITGDSDKCAWSEHITEYHGAGDENRVRAQVLSASHHGSRTFFKTCEDDPKPYERHLELIDPTYLVISAPRRDESPHGHPHGDALELYKKKVAEDDVLHTGDGRKAWRLDVESDGSFVLKNDAGELAEAYPIGGDDDDDDGGDEGRKTTGPYVITPRIDRRPMGKR
jgi:competence protein ComEC